MPAAARRSVYRSARYWTAANHCDARARHDLGAREVKTKFRKTFTTYFFPVGDEIREIVVDWVTYLRQTKLWGNDDPLFPATETVVGANRRFEAAGLKR